MNLVIVESPSKAKTIKKYLGKDYIVKASKGHVIDLPKSQIGVDVEKRYSPEYVVTKPKVIKELKDAYKGADKLILAVDLDREGEAIGWHIAQKLGAIDKKGNVKEGHSVERIVFSEITKAALQEAIKDPRKISIPLVNAQQARRVLDRLVGYKLSPVLWKKIRFGLSAGRVQSAALRLVVEKEDERRAFNELEYWSMHVMSEREKIAKLDINFLLKDDETTAKDLQERYEGKIDFEIYQNNNKKISIENNKQAEKIAEDIKNNSEGGFQIEAIEKKTTQRKPSPPLITSTLQRFAVNKLGYTAKRTMGIAQKLYEKGYITYMRTDSLSMSQTAITAARNYIKKKYGVEYLSESQNIYKSKSKNAQEAHECIRPVDFNQDISSDKTVTDEMIKLYDLIKSKALASQSVPARLENVSILSTISTYGLKAKGVTVAFDGFLRITGEKVSENELPNFQKGERLFISAINSFQHFTQPPARYSEASLIKALEELGIGRPSTYASIISTIQSRKYVDKEGKYLIPTMTGEVVNRLLVKYFNNIVNYDFTSNIEERLDDIAEGKEDWVTVLDEFYKPFILEIEKGEKEIPREEFTVVGDAPDEIKCPVCGSKMIVKLGRYGQFYSCSKFPDCDGILSLDGKTEEDVQKETQTKEFMETYEPAPKTEDGREFIYKKGRFGYFWAHPDYPKVKDARPLVMIKSKIIELYGDFPKTEDGRDYEFRSGKFGYFWAHPDYPKVKDIKKVRKLSEE